MYPSFITIFLFCKLMTQIRANTANAVYSSCTGRGITTWNKNIKTVSLEIKSWLQSMVSVRSDMSNNVDDVSSMLYSPRLFDSSVSMSEFSKHTFGYNDVLSGDHTDDNDRRRRTVSKFKHGPWVFQAPVIPRRARIFQCHQRSFPTRPWPTE